MAIARRDDPSLASDVSALLAGPDPLVRAHTARGLGESTAPAASGLLAEAYSFEGDAFVRRAVLGAAGERPRQESTDEALELAAQLDPDPMARELARRALRGGASAAASVPEVAWMQVVPAERATLPADLEGVVVESDGLAMPVAFDEEGFALLPGVPPGECRLRLAPSVPPYSPSGQ
jgi:HEAT repeat protein